MAKAKGTLPQANTTRTKLSALDAIDATLQPIGPQPALRAEVDRLVELKDVDSLVALFEAYEAAAMAFLSLENQAGRSAPIYSGRPASLAWKAWSRSTRTGRTAAAGNRTGSR